MRLARIIAIVAALAAIVVPRALALAFTDASYNIPTGVVGQPFSHQFDGMGGCGPGLPYQFRVINGSLPTGLVLEKNGLLHGTPTTAGDASFWVELSDENRRQLWIPRGLAHGFVVRSETAEFFYKCDEFYSPSDELVLRWDDLDLGIDCHRD